LPAKRERGHVGTFDLPPVEGPGPSRAVAGPLTAADPVGGLGNLLSGDRRHERISDAECQVL
jgi:hypothetical protein